MNMQPVVATRVPGGLIQAGSGRVSWQITGLTHMWAHVVSSSLAHDLCYVVWLSRSFRLMSLCGEELLTFLSLCIPKGHMRLQWNWHFWNTDLGLEWKNLIVASHTLSFLRWLVCWPITPLVSQISVTRHRSSFKKSPAEHLKNTLNLSNFERKTLCWGCQANVWLLLLPFYSPFLLKRC